MKKILYLSLIALFAVACGSTPSEKSDPSATESTATKSEIKTYTVTEIINNGAELVGQEVNVQGFITHTCKHSGRRCFVVSKDDSELTLRVEAGGKIGGFNRELSGVEVVITGVVMENRLTKEYLDQYEEQLNEQIEENGSVESCGSELANVAAIKAKLKAEGKDYHSTYYMNGIDYKEITTDK